MINIDAGRYFKKLKPTQWKHHEAMDGITRAKYFFLPGVNNILIVSEAQKACQKFVSNKVNLATARCEFIKAIDSTKYSNQFDQAATFYSGLIHGANQLLTSLDPDLVKRWPLFEFEGKFCTGECEKLAEKAFPKYSKISAKFYPPWHLGCKLLIEESERISPDKEPNIDGSARFCNPFDFLIAFNFISLDELNAVLNSPRTSKNRGCLKLFIKIIFIIIGIIICWSIWG